MRWLDRGKLYTVPTDLAYTHMSANYKNRIGVEKQDNTNKAQTNLFGRGFMSKKNRVGRWGLFFLDLVLCYRHER